VEEDVLDRTTNDDAVDEEQRCWLLLASHFPRPATLIRSPMSKLARWKSPLPTYNNTTQPVDGESDARRPFLIGGRHRWQSHAETSISLIYSNKPHV
jgi:hypothetical protein